MAWERQAESSVDQSPQAQSSVAQTPAVSAISTPGHPAPGAEHQAQSPVSHSPATDKAVGELLRQCLRSVPGTGEHTVAEPVASSQGWSSSWWANHGWENQQWQQQQWQQPASNNASTWGAGPGETRVPWGATHGEPGHAPVASTQTRAPPGPAEPGPCAPWPSFREVSHKPQWI